MRALRFLIGDWTLDYTVTRKGQTSRPICGDGQLRQLFGETYLTFDYQVRDRGSGAPLGGAHGIFAWDGPAGHYRYFWYESSGALDQAKGWLRGEETLFLEWQGSDCTQIFRRLDPAAMYLEMTCPSQDLLLRVDFSLVVP